MDNGDTYIEIKNPVLCIICLEELDNNIKNICINCNVKCHTKCLRNWYKSKKKQVCPICLKTKKYYEKKGIKNNNIEDLSIVLNEENRIEEILDNQNIENNNINEEEINEAELNEEEELNEEDNENRDIELINYYLHRQNDRNVCYNCVNELCCSKRTGSYILIFLLLVYTYTSIF